MLRCLAYCGLAGLGAPAMADVLPSGSRAVRHELVIEASQHFSEHDFFAAPVRGFGGSAKIAPGEPFTFSSKYGTRIYALEPGARFPEEHGTAPSVALASGEIPVSETSSVLLTSPVQAVTTRLRVAAVSGGVIQLEVVGHDVDRDLSVIAVAGAGLALGVAGLVVLARRRRRGAVEG